MARPLLAIGALLLVIGPCWPAFTEVNAFVWNALSELALHFKAPPFATLIVLAALAFHTLNQRNGGF